MDPDLAWQNVRPDLDPNCLTHWKYSWKIFFFNLKKKSTDDKKSMQNYPACKELKTSHNSSRWHSEMFLFFRKKNKIDISCELSAKQKCQALFSLKRRKNWINAQEISSFIFSEKWKKNINAVCYSLYGSLKVDPIRLCLSWNKQTPRFVIFSFSCSIYINITY